MKECQLSVINFVDSEQVNDRKILIDHEVVSQMLKVENQLTVAYCSLFRKHNEHSALIVRLTERKKLAMNQCHWLNYLLSSRTGLDHKLMKIL